MFEQQGWELRERARWRLRKGECWRLGVGAVKRVLACCEFTQLTARWKLSCLWQQQASKAPVALEILWPSRRPRNGAAEWTSSPSRRGWFPSKLPCQASFSPPFSLSGPTVHNTGPPAPVRFCYNSHLNFLSKKNRCRMTLIARFQPLPLAPITLTGTSELLGLKNRKINQKTCLLIQYYPGSMRFLEGQDFATQGVPMPYGNLALYLIIAKLVKTKFNISG